MAGMRIGLAPVMSTLKYVIGGLLLCGTVSACLSLVFYEMTFSIPALDDYWRAGSTASIGLMKSFQAEYLGWSGRFLSTSLEYSLNYLIYIRLSYPVFIILVWLSSLTLIYFSILALFDVRRDSAAIQACSLEAIRLCVITGSEQSLFWLTGELENFFNISLGIFLCATMLRLQVEDRRPSITIVAALAAASFFAVGFHELFGSMFVASLALVIAAVCIKERRIRIWPMIVLGAAVVGIFVVVMAPGNAGRMSFMPKDFDRPLAVLAAACKLDFLR